MLVKQAEKKIENTVQKIKNNKSPREGIGFLSHISGLFGQRLYFYNKTNHYTDKVKINIEKCVGCGKCVKLCPMKNLKTEDNFIKTENRCTMCYRCINICPKQAITLLGKHVVMQGTIEKYL